MRDMYDVPTDPISKALAQPVSRRGFFGITAVVGALFFTGSACKGRLLAYADEAGNAYFVVTILSREEVAALVTDSTVPNKVLKGVEVTVKSLYNDKTVTATTDQYGRAVLNIRALSQQSADPNAEDYFFWGSATIKLAGYREIAIERYLLNGGPTPDQHAHLEFGTQPYNAAQDAAYLRMVSFDGSDIQYTDLDMPQFKGDTATHTLTVQVGCAAGRKATVKFLGNGKVIAQGSGTSDAATGYATIAMKGRFVQEQAVGTVFTLDFAVEGASPQTAPLKLKVSTPNVEFDAPFMTDNALLSAGCGSGTGDPSWKKSSNADVEVNKNVVNITGMPFDQALKICADFPWLPVTFAMLPEGAMGISLNMQTFSIYNNDKGWFENEGWMTTGIKGMASKWAEKFWDGFSDGIDRAAKAKTPDAKGKCHPQYFHSVNATFDVSIAALIWYKDKKYWDGSLGVTGTFKLACEWGWQFQAGPIPMFACFDMTLLLVLAARMGLSFEKGHSNPFAHPRFAYKEGPSGGANAAINFTADGGFTVGVGIKGVFSVGLRGFVTIPFGIEFFTQKKGEKEKPYPHISLKISAGVQCVVQVLMFKVNHTMIQSRKAPLYDNWPDEKLLTGTEETQWEDFPEFYKDPALSLDDESLFVTEDGMVMTTDRDLLDGADDYIEVTMNAQGVPTLMDTSNFCSSLDENGILHQIEAPGFIDPYGSATLLTAANGETSDGMVYDARMGIKPSIEEVISGRVFSDPRVKVVQCGQNTVYFCRLTLEKIRVNSNYCTVVEDDGLFFLIPNQTTGGVPRFAEFIEPNSVNEIGYFKYPDYEQIEYGQGTGVAVDPPVASIDVPRYVNDSADAINARMREVAKLVSGQLNNSRSDYESVMANVVNPEVVSRIRVAVTPFNTTTRTWGEDDVIDFVIPSEGITTMRTNMNDVDFEVSTDGNTLIFGLVSCARSWQKEKTFDEQKENLFSSVLRYDPAKPLGKRVYDVHSNLYEFAKRGEYEWKAHPVSVKSGGTKKLGLVCAGRRGADQAMSVHYYGGTASNGTEPNTHVIIPSGEYKLNDYGQPFAYIDSSLKDASGDDVVVLGWQYSDVLPTNDAVKPGYASQHAGVWTVGASNGAQLGHWDFKGAQNLCCLGGEKGFAFVRPVQSGEQHLELCNVKFDTKKPDALSNPVVLGVTDTGQFYSGDNGNYLYGMRIMEGSAPEMDPETRANILACDEYYGNTSGVGAAQSDLLTVAKANDNAPTDVKQYQVMCTRWDPYWHRYRTFFPYAQLGKAPDQSSCFQTGSGTCFIYSSITNFAKQKADITYAEVPPVKGIQLEGAACADSFVGKGAKVHPHVRVTNTGNVPLCGFTVNFSKKEGGTPFVSVKLDKLEDHVLKAKSNDLSSFYAEFEPESLHTVANDTPWGQDEEALIWPGSVRTYVVECKVPDEWTTGTHEIYVTISDAVEARLNGSNGGESMLFGAEIDEENILSMVDPRAAEMPVDMSELKLETPSVAPCTYLPRGDVNGNGCMNIVDAQVAYDIANGEHKEREDYAEMYARANVNGNDKVDAGDAFAVQRAVHYGWVEDEEE